MTERAGERVGVFFCYKCLWECGHYTCLSHKLEVLPSTSYMYIKKISSQIKLTSYILSKVSTTYIYIVFIQNTIALFYLTWKLAACQNTIALFYLTNLNFYILIATNNKANSIAILTKMVGLCTTVS